MSIVMVGVSHRSAPVAVLEEFVLEDHAGVKLMQHAVETTHVSEAVVVSTCNRVEIYVEADRFHGSVEDITSLLLEHASLDRSAALKHIYVHYEDAAVAHLFSVASGLDSMVLGESQILGQVRAALKRGQDEDTAGPVLNALFQQALRIGKRGHAESGIDQAAPSVVTAAMEQVRARGIDLSGARVLLVGAGSMAALSATHLTRLGVFELVVLNRTRERADRLAASVGGTVADWRDLHAELARADVVICCTGSTGLVVTAEAAEAAVRGGGLTLIDLALPRDVERRAAGIPGVTLVGLAEVADGLADGPIAADVAKVREIVSSEVAAFLASRNAARVTPTVIALRSMATEIVDAELGRLRQRRPDLEPELVSEVSRTVQRVADKLLHAPTVRVKELAGSPEGLSYADALAELFSLDASAVDAVTEVDASAVDAVIEVDAPTVDEIRQSTTYNTNSESQEEP